MADEIIKVLDELAARMGVVIDWSTENVLPYVTELGEKLVRFKLVESVFWVLASVVLSLILWRFMKWACRTQTIEYGYKDWNGTLVTKTKQYTPFDDNVQVMVVGYVLMGVEIILAIKTLMFEVETILAAITFPEKIILEYLQGVM